MRAIGNPLLLAALALAIVCPGVTRPLAAQRGGQQGVRPAAAAPVERESESPTLLLEPARAMLRHLVGRWRFEIRFAGNFDGPPDASGTRLVDTLFDDLRLQWSEIHDDSSFRAQGFVGFDPRTGRFYSTAVHSSGTGTELLTGALNTLEPLVTFTPVAGAPGRQAMESFTWTMVDRDHFIWAPLDRGWRAVFTRER